MGKFKVGDRVRSLDQEYESVEGWPNGFIVGVNKSGRLWQVDFGNGSRLNHFEHEIELDDLLPDFGPTLRDRFAMAALTGHLAHYGAEADFNVADDAYHLADLMMKARERIK